MNRFKIHTFLAAILLGSLASISAQDYEDDIYFNPDKAKSQKATTTAAVASSSSSYSTIPAADTYTQGALSQRAISVDDYNRRGIFAQDSATAQTNEASDFAYTRRIEQFYNPDVVTASADPELAQYYYSEPASSVNIIVNTPSYWGYPYYGRAWAWASPYYSYWGGWDPWYGPSWSWNWGWSYPYYPAWSWRPAWSHRPGWGWAGPVRPNRPSGYQRPGYNRPGYGTGSSRPGYSRPGSNSGYSRPGSGNGYTRPGNSNSNNSGYSRPGNSNSSNSGYSRPGNSNNSYRPSTGSSSGYSRGSGSSSGYSRGSGGSYSGGSRGGGGGRGRH